MKREEVIRYMRRAISLAKRGEGKTSPNPCVGAVLVKNGRIVGEGYHRKVGLPHAEVEAINSACVSLKGASMFVTLEPCVHHGRTPPCVEEILKSGISEVYIGTIDPNPLVKGKGKKKLEENGVRVFTGILEEECRSLNPFYNKFITTKLPYITLKLAMTLNGGIYVPGRKYISCKESLKYVHKLRSKYDAVLVGRRTVEIDNPFLTVRLVKGRNPVRVIISNSLKFKQNLNVFSNDAKTVLFTTRDVKDSKNFSVPNIEVIKVKSEEDGVSLGEVMKNLGNMGITSVLVEGGKKTIYSFIKKRLFDDFILIISPFFAGNASLFLHTTETFSPLYLEFVKSMKKGRDMVIIMHNVYRDNRINRKGC